MTHSRTLFVSTVMATAVSIETKPLFLMSGVAA